MAEEELLECIVKIYASHVRPIHFQLGSFRSVWSPKYFWNFENSYRRPQDEQIYYFLNFIRILQAKSRNCIQFSQEMTAALPIGHYRWVKSTQIGVQGLNNHRNMSLFNPPPAKLFRSTSRPESFFLHPLGFSKPVRYCELSKLICMFLVRTRNSEIIERIPVLGLMALKIQVQTLLYDLSYARLWTFCRLDFSVDFKIHMWSKCISHKYKYVPHNTT